LPVEIRPAVPADGDQLGRICFEAFGGIARERGFAPDFPSLDYAIGVVDSLIENPSVYGVAAELDGHIVGSNFLDERDQIAGVGPISVDPRAQASGVGRMLMEAVIERGRRSAGVRLLQDAHNPVSLSLYAALGFEVKEPVALMAGRLSANGDRATAVRPLQQEDIAACAALCRGVHEFDRSAALRDSLAFSPLVAEREGRLVAYASSLTSWPLAHGVAATESDMRALVAGGAATLDAPVSFLVPMRLGGFYRWCLERGMRTLKTMNLMALGAYRDPAGYWFPSVGY
jgi:GNAT superfamily N-acetyltransferase